MKTVEDTEFGVAFGVLYTHMSLYASDVCPEPGWFQEAGQGFGTFQWCCRLLRLNYRVARTAVLQMSLQDLRDTLASYEQEENVLDESPEDIVD